MSDRIGGNDALPLQPSESGEGRSETAGLHPFQRAVVVQYFALGIARLRWSLFQQPFDISQR